METALDEAADRYKEAARIFICNFLIQKIQLFNLHWVKFQDWVPFECDDKVNEICQRRYGQLNMQLHGRGFERSIFF